MSSQEVSSDDSEGSTESETDSKYLKEKASQYSVMRDKIKSDTFDWSMLEAERRYSVKPLRSRSSRQLDFMETAVFVSEILRAEHMLSIVGHQLPVAVAQEDLAYKSTEERYGGPPVRHLVYPDEVDEHRKESSLARLQRLRTGLAEVLRRSRREMDAYGTWMSLRSVTDALEAMEVDDQALMASDRKNRAVTAQLQLDLTAAARHNSGNNAVGTEIADLEAKLHDQVVIGGIERRFVERWERSRRAQAAYGHRAAQRALEVTLTDTQEQIEVETRVNAEVEIFISTKKQQRQQEIADWMRKYDEDGEAMDEKILRLNTAREKLKVEADELRDTYHQHKQEMADHQAVLEGRRRAVAHQEHLNKMATRIQAWWRGVMVRRHLGPYKIKKKGKGKKDKLRTKGSAMRIIEERQGKIAKTKKKKL